MHQDSDRALADIAAAQDGIFSFEDARRAGFTKRQVDRRTGRSWSVLYDAVYRVSGAPPTWRSKLRAACLAGGKGAAISRRSAAAMYELPPARTDIVELTCVRWKRTTHPGLIVHESRRLDPLDIRSIDGIPVTSPERIVLDMASHFPNANYLELLIQAARRKRLITYESTKEMFDRNARRGLKGVTALREALERWDPESRPTESEMETLLLQALRENGLPEPVVQFEVLDAAGQFVARVDAAYPAARILIEYDSKQEHSDEFQIARDASRRDDLQALGYRVLTARHADMRTGGTKLAGRIAAIMRRPLELA